eukprot:364613-Chlamydomonas_euryale.AAC.13
MCSLPSPPLRPSLSYLVAVVAPRTCAHKPPASAHTCAPLPEPHVRPPHLVAAVALEDLFTRAVRQRPHPHGAVV